MERKKVTEIRQRRRRKRKPSGERNSLRGKKECRIEKLMTRKNANEEE